MSAENEQVNAIYDTIIIGTGPAGVAAAIYAIRREMKLMLIGKEMGGQMALSGDIENYPGFTSIGNFELISKLQEHLKSAGVPTKFTEVQRIEKTPENTFVIYTPKDRFETRTVIIAMGLEPRRLAIPGEERLAGKGISYCANCDGPLYRNKVVAVVGGGNAALDAAEVLSKIATKVYLVHRSENFRAFEELVNEVRGRENIEILLDSEIKEMVGEKKLEKIVVFNNQTKAEKEVAVDGVFIEIGRVAHTDLLANLVERNQWNQIVVDEKCRTSAEGIYAAGDVTQVEFKQITVAMGQGTIAALAAYQYLQLKQGKKVNGILDRSKVKVRQ